MKKITILFHLLICSFAYSQEIQFTSPSESDANHVGVVRTADNEFYSFSYTGEHKNYGELYIAKYVDGKKTSESAFGKSLKLTSDSWIDQVFLINGLPAIAIAQEKGKTMSLLIQKFNLECKPEGPLQSIQSYTKKGITIFENFDVSVSPNEKFILVRIYNNEEGKEGLLYKVVDENFATVSENLVKKMPDNTVGLWSFVNNKGQAYLFGSEYKQIDPGFYVDPYRLQRYGDKARLWNSTVGECLFRIEDNDVEETSCNREFKEATLMSDFSLQKKFSDSKGKNTLVNMTLYQDLTTEHGEKGIYVSMLDTEKSDISGFYWEFSKEFLLSTFTPKELKLYEKDKKEIFLNFNFNLLDYQMTGGGDFILTLEHNETIYGSNGNGGQSLVGYESTPLHIVKINRKGEVVWTQKIDKDQKANKKEKDVFSSCLSVYGDKVLVFFNDNVSNYDPSGKYAPVNGEVAKCKFSPSATTIACVTLDAVNGTSIRESLQAKNASEAKFMLTPNFDEVKFYVETTDVFRGISKGMEHFIMIK